jgi:ketosteroid isomerase-like protein
MSTASRFTPADHAAAIRRYFDACNAADLEALVECFTPDAVHYFPPGLPDVPWRGAGTIAKKCVAWVERGSQWTIEKILVSHDSPEAVIEWTHWNKADGTALRGDEWYRFDRQSGRIAEIRAYFAARPDRAARISELVGFDYAGRGYHLNHG